MQRKNKNDSSDEFTLIGKKRSLESSADGKNENLSEKKNSQYNYESIISLYKNMFGFNWEDMLFKQGQKILENLNPEAIIFLYNTIYFKQDLYNINLLNKSNLLNSFFEPFDFKYPDASLVKKSPVISDKINFVFQMIEIFDYYKKNISNNAQNQNQNQSNDDEFKNLYSFLLLKYQRIKNLNRLRVGSLIEKLNSWQNKEREKEELFNLINDDKEIYINQSELLKDNQIPNVSNKIMNNFCEYLKNVELDINKQKNNDEKIFETSIEINRTKNDENWTCFVCNNGYLEDNDIFYECEKCKISVHQNCYGIMTNDCENWLCDACKIMTKEESLNLECLLCPVRGGAMKQINLPSDCQFVKNLKKIRNKELDVGKNLYNSCCIIPKGKLDNVDKPWVHLSCALWYPDIFIQNFLEKTNIKLVDCISFSKFMEKCDICGKIGYGPTLKCNNKSCEFRCHPECGRINGYRLEIENKNNILTFNIYCYYHQPVKLSKIIEKLNKTKEGKIEVFAHFLKKTYRNYEKEYQKNITEFVHPVKLKMNS